MELPIHYTAIKGLIEASACEYNADFVQQLNYSIRVVTCLIRLTACLVL